MYLNRIFDRIILQQHLQNFKMSIFKGSIGKQKFDTIYTNTKLLRMVMKYYIGKL